MILIIFVLIALTTTQVRTNDQGPLRGSLREYIYLEYFGPLFDINSRGT